MIDQDTIFLLGQGKRLERIPHRLYESEVLLQELIDQYPELLVGEQIDPDNPPRWLMVQREAGIPDSEGGFDRWSIDHVLLDQHGRPTLIEVKRSTDTRIRREVVGQMLDYAANALKYWPKDRIRELAANQYGGLEALEARVRDLLDDQETDIEEFWQAVDRNLREGELRLLFVADQIPTELRRIIEFLNENMPRVEVLGVEIRQYERDGTRVLVPRVVGQTEFARQSKSKGRRKPKLTEREFLEHAANSQVRKFAQEIFDWARDNGNIDFVSKSAGIRVPFSTLRKGPILMRIFPDGKVFVTPPKLKRILKSAGVEEDLALEIATGFKRLYPGVKLRPDENAVLTPMRAEELLPKVDEILKIYRSVAARIAKIDPGISVNEGPEDEEVEYDED